MAWLDAPVEDLALERLDAFRSELYGCFTARADALFELCDALVCTDGPVKTLAGLSLAPEHRRGHGALYDAVDHGQVEIGRLRRAVAAGGGCEQLAAAGRGDEPGPAVLPRLRAGEGPGADDPGVAVLGGGRPGAGPHLLDRGAGRGPPGPR